MSEKVVYEFFSKVVDAAGLQQKLKDLGPEPTDDAIEGLLQIAKEEGCEFSAEDYRAVINRVPDEADGFVVRDADGIGVPYDCTEATAWRGHPPAPHGCSVAWGCGVDHPMYGGPHIPICATRPV